MLVYKDQTFCKFHEDCMQSTVCGRALTDEVKAKAEEWWGDAPGGAPISVFLDKPPCFIAKEEISCEDNSS